jgi:hypothetical protein
MLCSCFVLSLDVCITVLHSAEVVHIPHESRSSLIAGSRCTGEYPYTLPGCVLGHHYKVVQWFSLVCSVPTEVSPEVAIQITKGPLLHHVVLRRVHSITHSTGFSRKDNQF